ncbi:GlxA family transcriptional regulator [Saccharothrix sp. ST-888]|uniref:GlxA family transcriptional regulator n=1 Tax=Saccharothrix sp. ST-888 TaxID=1427391 RepID=UPI0005ED2775|nr:helix-turn-helix domain-containing protein [Saccharothrix sp. ST-888]KJK55816.1 AraC family transcriptional regulator [Saccharothrix sp. ST-888]
MEIAILVVDGVFDSGLAAVLDVLRTADELRDEIPNPPYWRARTVGIDGPVTTAAGHQVPVLPADEAIDRADLVVLPGLSGRTPQALVSHVASAECEPVRRLLADAHARGRRIASACSGTVLLAETGILNGRHATTSWWLAPTFRERYPEVLLDDTRMVVESGSTITAGAAFGHVDLALAIVRMLSPALAELVSRYLVVDDRPSQATYAVPSILAKHDPTVAAFESWIRAHLAEPLCLPDAARALGISERTLQRAVRRTLDTTPVRFAQDIRAEQASHLLRTTDLPVEAVARRVGYENGNTLRILLRERRGVTVGMLRRH